MVLNDKLIQKLSENSKFIFPPSKCFKRSACTFCYHLYSLCDKGVLTITIKSCVYIKQFVSVCLTAAGRHDYLFALQLFDTYTCFVNAFWICSIFTQALSQPVDLLLTIHCACKCFRSVEKFVLDQQEPRAATAHMEHEKWTEYA